MNKVESISVHRYVCVSNIFLFMALLFSSLLREMKTVSRLNVRITFRQLFLLFYINPRWTKNAIDIDDTDALNALYSPMCWIDVWNEALIHGRTIIVSLEIMYEWLRIIQRQLLFVVRAFYTCFWNQCVVLTFLKHVGIKISNTYMIMS